MNRVMVPGTSRCGTCASARAPTSRRLRVLGRWQIPKTTSKCVQPEPRRAHAHRIALPCVKSCGRGRCRCRCRSRSLFLLTGELALICCLFGAPLPPRRFDVRGMPAQPETAVVGEVGARADAQGPHLIVRLLDCIGTETADGAAP